MRPFAVGVVALAAAIYVIGLSAVRWWTAGLQARGYSDADIRKVLGENLLRVWRAVEAKAAR